MFVGYVQRFYERFLSEAFFCSGIFLMHLLGVYTVDEFDEFEF